MATKNANAKASTRKSTRKANDAAKTPQVSCSMALNEAHNGVELTFSAKPSDGIREAMKSAGFRWHTQRGVWYAKQTPDTLTIAKALSEGSVEGAEVKASAKPKKSATKAKPKASKASAKAKAEPRAPKAKAPKVEQKALAYKGTAKPKASAKLIKALNETEGLTVEMDRTWLWVSGDTRPYSESLKALGFRFSGRRQAWYLA